MRKVVSILSRANPHYGPGKLKGRVIRECATQLGDVITQLFQWLLDSSFVFLNMERVHHYT